MKKFDTEYISNKKAYLEELKIIVENLFTEHTEEWISLYDTSKKNPNYIQVHYDIEILDEIIPVIDFITSVLHYDSDAINERDFYLIEYRKYENKEIFKHYRAFFDKSETIISYIEKYLNDEEINIENWIDVTEEFEVYDSLKEDLENKLLYLEENEEDFFNQINELTDKNKFLACIEVLENIPIEDRNYEICYQLARAYQNFAIVGEDEKETEYELGSELLKTSISILESIKEEGQHKAEWNMRMAYGYQYLEDKEELAIPYALRWAELDPGDKDAMFVVEECKNEIKNRERKQNLVKVYKIAEDILKKYDIKDSKDYWNRDLDELDEIEEKIYLATSNYKLDQEDIMDIIDNVLEDFENRYGGNNMKNMAHEFFGNLDLEKGLNDEIDFGDNTIVLWEEDVNGINTTLWYDKQSEITTEILDVFAKFISDFKQNDEKSRKALEENLLEDNEYITFHREELEFDVPKEARQFVQSMKINNIGFWIDGENIIIVDYMINPEESDEILAVIFNNNFEITDISWES